MGRFETGAMTEEKNLTALADLSGRWIDRVQTRRGRMALVLDIDSSVSPTYGAQEGTAYNGHFACTCYHPLFVFNQDGDLERCALRPGNVHSAHGWREVLDPVVARYRGQNLRRLLRGDAAFALPDVYEYLEAEGFQYAPSAREPSASGADRAAAQATRRPPTALRAALLRELPLPGPELEPIASSGRERRVAPRRAVPARRHHCHQPASPGQEGRRLLQWPGDSRAVDQGRQARSQVDAALVHDLPRECRPAAAPRAGVQPRQLPAHPGLAGRGRRVVADQPPREGGEDRREGR